MVKNVATDYTFPEDRGICGFCGKSENGYAEKDASGNWQAACWSCVKPSKEQRDMGYAQQQKKKTVGTVFTDVDADADEVKSKMVKKNPGIAPSNYRPKVN